MPSDIHQWLVLWVARKLAVDGYTISGYDGPTPQGGAWNRLPLPPLVQNVRPDVFGTRAGYVDIAYGEAKTEEDVLSAHTCHQFLVLAETVKSQGARLYFGVPRSASWLLDRALNRAGLLGSKSVVRVHVPDILVSAGVTEYA